jgi:hypothetical protein
MIVVLWGPPCSGKSTYIAERMQPGDVRVDLDVIIAALMPPSAAPYSEPHYIRRLALDAREAVMASLHKVPRDVTAYVIDSNADKAGRARWHRRGAQVVKVEAPYAVCIARGREQGRPPEYEERVRSWFARHRPESLPQREVGAVEPASQAVAVGASRSW